MAWLIPLSVTNTGSGILLGTDDLFVSAGVTVASTGSDGVYASGVGQSVTGHPRIVVHGTVVGEGGGITLYETRGASVTVGQGGRVTGLLGPALSTLGTGTSVVNHGVMETLEPISAVVQMRAFVAGSTSSLVNTGLIEGGSFSVLTTGPLAHSFNLTNSGTIRAGTAFADDTDVGSTDTIVNTGLIDGYVLLGSGNDRFDGTAGRLVGLLSGGGGDDVLLAGAGAQTISGGDGADVLAGGLGPDLLDGGAGRDFASYARAAAGVRVDLAAPATNAGEAGGDRLLGVESLVGSAFADVLNGDAGFNVLSGGAGGDVIRGRGGNDVLAGQGGADRFVFDTQPSTATNADRILDFQPGVDDVVLENAVYAALAAGALAPGAFRASAMGLPADAGDRILYETNTGWLLYDRDGTGAAAAVRFAQVGAGLGLTAADFLVA